MDSANPAITTSTTGRKMLIQFRVDTADLQGRAEYHADGKGQLPLTLVFKNAKGQSSLQNLESGARAHVKLTVKKREIVHEKQVEQPPAVLPTLTAAPAYQALTSNVQMTPQSSLLEQVETLIEANFETVEEFLLDLRREASSKEYDLLVSN